MNADPSEKEGGDSEPRISFWVVAFLDILGYRSILESIDVFPLTPDVLPDLEKAFGRAIRLRRRLFHMIENALEDDEPQTDVSYVSPEAQELAAKWRKANVIRNPGPDHVVLACSLEQRDQHFPLRGVFNLIVAVAGAMLTQLSLGASDPEGTLPLRGGIDLAAGTYLSPEDFLYSPALTRAYDLERKEAQYGRTAVGKRFIHFLDSAAGTIGADPESQIRRNIARLIRGLFFLDRDGVFVLDFLSPTLGQTSDSQIGSDAVRDAFLFVLGAHRKERERCDYAVAAKYAWLIDYMRPRLSAWGVDLSDIERQIKLK